VRIPAVVLVFALFVQFIHEPSYRILQIGRSGDKGEAEQGAKCIISLPSSVNVMKLKSVVCDFICRENLRGEKKMGIMIYHSIRKLGIPMQDKYLIGIYKRDPAFNMSGRLLVALDDKGKPIKDGIMEFEFTHEKDCSCMQSK
jgi:hypothetical protein